MKTAAFVTEAKAKKILGQNMVTAEEARDVLTRAVQKHEVSFYDKEKKENAQQEIDGGIVKDISGFQKVPCSEETLSLLTEEAIVAPVFLAAVASLEKIAWDLFPRVLQAAWHREEGKSPFFFQRAEESRYAVFHKDVREGLTNLSIEEQDKAVRELKPLQRIPSFHALCWAVCVFERARGTRLLQNVYSRAEYTAEEEGKKESVSSTLVGFFNPQLMITQWDGHPVNSVSIMTEYILFPP